MWGDGQDIRQTCTRACAHAGVGVCGCAEGECGVGLAPAQQPRQLLGRWPYMRDLSPGWGAGSACRQALLCLVPVPEAGVLGWGVVASPWAGSVWPEVG